MMTAILRFFSVFLFLFTGTCESNESTFDESNAGKYYVDHQNLLIDGCDLLLIEKEKSLN